LACVTRVRHLEPKALPAVLARLQVGTLVKVRLARLAVEGGSALALKVARQVVAHAAVLAQVGVGSTLVNVGLAQRARIARARTVARERIDAVLAKTVVGARLGRTLVDVDLAELAPKPSVTRAAKPINQIIALPVGTTLRVARTLVNVVLAALAVEASTSTIA
jgi:hypothetical protein